MYDDLFEKAVEARYPGLLDGSRRYSFNDAESVAARKRHDKISRIMEASFNESEKVVISNEEYHFI